MEIVKMPIAELAPADYNPRKDLQPGDPEYEDLERSVEEFGLVLPPIFNKRFRRLVGGHQRLKPFAAKGATEVETVIVDLSEEDEKILNTLLNKVTGRWDYDKLSPLLEEIQQAGGLENTGFKDWEVEALNIDYGHIDDLLSESFSDTGKTERDTFTMTFTLPAEAREAVDHYVATHENGKTELSTAIVNKVKGVL